MDASSEPEAMLSTQFDALVAARAPDKTICPSEVARSLTSAQLDNLGVSAWHDLMPRLREMAFAARDRGEVEILQRGQVVGSDTPIQDVRGPIRIRAAKGQS